jgi:hypothetical protein
MRNCATHAVWIKDIVVQVLCRLVLGLMPTLHSQSHTKYIAKDIFVCLESNKKLLTFIILINYLSLSLIIINLIAWI